MAHNTVLPTSDAGGNTIITVDLSLDTYPTGTGQMPASCLYVSADATTAPTPVTDANPLPVDGTVTANLSATDNAVLDAIAASVAGTLTVGSHAVTGPLTDTELRATAVPVSGTFFQATQPISIAAAQTLATVTTVGAVTAITNALPAGTNAIGKLAANSGVDIGDVDVLSIAAGANLIGDVSLQPRTTGGLTMHKTTSAASTNATSVKASAGQVYSIQCSNVNAAARYLKLYNKASAPTVGTDTPVKTLIIPGNTAGAGFVIPWPQGLAFATGIAFALTTEATDAGTTGVAANELTVNIDYK